MRISAWNLGTVTVLGTVLTSLYEKPDPYETRLLVPGVVWAVVGYAIGEFLREGPKGVYWTALLATRLGT
jgi:hypothetical protein